MINWQNISTVFLDMDGTLLDLRFDNYFWLEYLPQVFAETHVLPLADAKAYLQQLSEQKKGTLDWYCLHHWSQCLNLVITELKQHTVHLITERPYALEFLAAIKASGLTLALITNAHPESLALKLKHSRIESFFHHIYSAHDFGYPKESYQFWSLLSEKLAFAPENTLFIDDNEQVLASAHGFGLRHLYCIAQPDSRGAVRTRARYPVIAHFEDVMPPPLL